MPAKILNFISRKTLLYFGGPGIPVLGLFFRPTTPHARFSRFSRKRCVTRVQLFQRPTSTEISYRIMSSNQQMDLHFQRKTDENPR